MSNFFKSSFGDIFFYGAYQGCIYLIKNGYYCEKMFSMLIYFIIIIYAIYSYDCKAEFSALHYVRLKIYIYCIYKSQSFE